MTEVNAYLKVAIESIRSEGWARGYAACREAQRTELEWQRAEIERLRVALIKIRDDPYGAPPEDWAYDLQEMARRALDEQKEPPSTACHLWPDCPICGPDAQSES